MFGFVKKAFRKFFEFWLWFNLIVCTAGGGVGFYFLTGSRSWYSGSYEANGGFVFLGVLIGFVVGFMSNILAGGLIATFLNMDENIEKLLKGNLPSEASTEVPDLNSTEKQVHLSSPPSGEVGDVYIVKINTSLRGDPTESSNIVKPLKVDDKVFFQYAPNPNWFYVYTSDSQKGWCLAGHLKKA
jgi:hypothetical protein